MNLPDALKLASTLRDKLAPACDRCEIAAGVRRRKEDPHDIELVVIPKDIRPPVTFGQKTPIFKNVLTATLWELEQEHLLAFDLGKDKYRKYTLDPSKWGVDMGPTATVKFDLFIVTSETWGYQYTIRTGPADFSHWLVTPTALGGALPDGLSVKDARVWPGPMNTAEEINFLNALGVGWIEPSERKTQWRKIA